MNKKENKISGAVVGAALVASGLTGEIANAKGHPVKEEQTTIVESIKDAEFEADVKRTSEKIGDIDQKIKQKEMEFLTNQEVKEYLNRKGLKLEFRKHLNQNQIAAQQGFDISINGDPIFIDGDGVEIEDITVDEIFLRLQLYIFNKETIDLKK